MSDTPTLVFDGSEGVTVDVPKMMTTGVLVSGSPDAGKSYLLRYMIEQTAPLMQQFVIDSEGEFKSLREKFPFLLVSADGEGDVVANPATARTLAHQLAELGVSAILDVSELDPGLGTPDSPREKFVGLFLRELINLPRSKWRSRLVVIDEVHELAPQTGDSKHPSLYPVQLLVSKGRKRGLASLFATQRISKLHKDAADLGNMLVGYTAREVDVARAQKELGLLKSTADELRTIPRGEFFALGPAISREMRRVRSGDIQTSHPRPGEIAKAPPPTPAKITAMLSKLHDIGEQKKREENELEDLKKQLVTAQSRIKSLEKGAPAPVVQPAREVVRTVVDEKAIERAVAAESKRLKDHIKLLERHAESIQKEFSRTAGKTYALAKQIIEQTETIPAPQMPRMEAVAVPAGLPGKLEDRDDPTQEDALRAIGHHRREAKIAPAPTEGFTGPEQRILDAYAMFEALRVPRPDRVHVASFSNYNKKSKSFVNAISSLRVKGYLDKDGYPTEAGRRAGRTTIEIKGLDDFHRAWYERLTTLEQKIMTELIFAYPDRLGRADLASKVDYNVKSKSFVNSVSHLRSLGLLEHDSAGTYATDAWFPAGLV